MERLSSVDDNVHVIHTGGSAGGMAHGEAEFCGRQRSDHPGFASPCFHMETGTPHVRKGEFLPLKGTSCIAPLALYYSVEAKNGSKTHGEIIHSHPTVCELPHLRRAF